MKNFIGIYKTQIYLIIALADNLILKACNDSVMEITLFSKEKN